MNKNKGFASIAVIGIIVLVVAIGGSLGVYYFNNPKNFQSQNIDLLKKLNLSSNISGEGDCVTTAGWPTYQNFGEDFQFHYPKNWITKNSTEQANIIDLIIYNESDLPDVENEGVIGIRRMGNASKNAGQTIQRFYDAMSKAEIPPKVIGFIYIKGQKSLQVVESPGGDTNPNNYWINFQIPSLDNTYILDFNALVPNQELKKKEFAGALVGILCSLELLQ
ncbi:MAG: hypothetical protein Q8L47_04980 [bacterium]|nr:hypothetical protein [bacterium]